jgi:hypothetical protein
MQNFRIHCTCCRCCTRNPFTLTFTSWRSLSIVASLSKSSAVARSLGNTTNTTSNVVVGFSQRFKSLAQSIGTGAVSPGNASSRRVYCENGLHMQARAAVEPVNARTAIELRPVLAESFPPMPSSQRGSVVARDLNYLQTGMESISVTVCLTFYFLAPTADHRLLVQAGLRRPVFRQRNNTISNGVIHYSQRTKYLDRKSP